MRAKLPYPPSILSPNARAHWGKISRAKKAYRWQCAILSRSIGKLNGASVAMTITFHPPMPKRVRDLDNMIAAFKAGADGVVETIGIDDSHWVPTYRVGELSKNGSVTIEITGVEA
jgi:crossover junction endodeoxyribonuclease RusA